VTFSLLLTNTSGSPVWEVRILIPGGFQILHALPPHDWGYAVEENHIVYQALTDSALVPENGKEEFEFTLQTPILGEAAEEKFKIQISAKNTREEVMEENLWLLVDNLPPTLKVEPEILGCGEVRLEIVASERMGNLSAFLLFENDRIPLQLSTKDGIVFEAIVKTPVGVEETANLFIENAYDLVGNCPIENVLFIKIDTIPPRVENCWLEKDGRVIAKGEVKGKVLAIRTSERRPEILFSVSDESGIENWELDTNLPCERVFENGIVKVIPKTELSGAHNLLLTVRDKATPPNEMHADLWLVIETEESVFSTPLLRLVLLIVFEAVLLYLIWKCQREVKQIQISKSQLVMLGLLFSFFAFVDSFIFSPSVLLVALEAALLYLAWKRQAVLREGVKQIQISKSQLAAGSLSLLLSSIAFIDSLRFSSSTPPFFVGASIVAIFLGLYARSCTMGKWGMILASATLGNGLCYVHYDGVVFKDTLSLVAISIAAWKPELTGWMSVLAGLWSLPISFFLLCTGAALALGILAKKKKDRLGEVGIFLGILSIFSMLVLGFTMAR
jgi:hypothetical protein